MKRTHVIAFLGGLALALAVRAADPAPAPRAYAPRLDAEGWEVLFDGKGLEAWDADPAAGVWAVTDKGELYPAAPGGNISTRQRYCDFVLELDYRVAADKKSNSGIFVRVHSLADPVGTGMEIQILDDAAYGVNWDAMNANGALYDLVHPKVDANVPPGQWNHARITVNDSLVVVELNGKEIVRADLNQWTKPNQNPDGTHNKFPQAIGALPREGFIALQNYGATPVWFRTVRLKTLGDRRPRYSGQEPISTVLQPLP